MAGFLDRIKRRGTGNDEAQQVISQFAEPTEPARVEIEGTPSWFYTTPLLRSGAVVLSMPQTLQKSVATDGWMRIRISEEQRKDLRLQVSSAKHGGAAHMALNPDQIAVLCKLSGAAIVSSLRSADRIGTSNYRDLTLEVRSPSGSYRVLNLSKNGAKIGVPEEVRETRFPLGTFLERGALRLGKKAAVSLLDIIPRCHYDGAVGLEVVIDPKGSSLKILEMFLDHIANKEQEAHEAESKRGPSVQPEPAPA